VRESGDQARQERPARWPVKVWMGAPVWADQIWAVASEAGGGVLVGERLEEGVRGWASLQQLAIQLPSGENFTAETARLWPRRMS